MLEICIARWGVSLPPSMPHMFDDPDLLVPSPQLDMHPSCCISPADVFATCQDARAALQSAARSPLPDAASKAEPMAVEADDDVDPSSMTIAQIKAWLVDNSHDGKVCAVTLLLMSRCASSYLLQCLPTLSACTRQVWELSKGSAKKADWVALMRSVM